MRTVNFDPENQENQNLSIPPDLLDRLRARIARRPGLWRRRMQPRRKRKNDEPHVTARAA